MMLVMRQGICEHEIRVMLSENMDTNISYSLSKNFGEKHQLFQAQ